MTILAEITPKKERGHYMSLIVISMSLGQLLSFIIGYFTLESFEKGNWRILIILSGIPGVIGTLVSLVFLDESARFLIV